MGFDSGHVEGRLGRVRREHYICKEQTVLGLAKVTGLEVRVGQSEAVLAPIFHMSVLVLFLVLKEVALAQEVVCPELVAAHFAHL